jgi:hypothetical protein
MSERLVFNGLDGASGRYLLPSMTNRELFDWLRHQKPRRVKGKRFRAVGSDVDARRLDQAGWGLVLAESAASAFAEKYGITLRSTLEPLCALRQRHAGSLYRDDVERPERPLMYRAGESAAQFLERYGVRQEDLVDPYLMPYYLLLVGSPEEIPFQVQFDLGLQYAVGRICFDEPDQYRTYACGVKAADEGTIRRRRETALFAVQNPNDGSTAATTAELAVPLQKRFSIRSGWPLSAWIGPPADRAQLARLLAGDERRPALLVTASHGVGTCGFCSAVEEEVQGALVCQDWGGKGVPLEREHYFAAADLDQNKHVDGLIALLFACYSAGTPQFDSFKRDDADQPLETAHRSFVSRLAQRMLSHPNGAALAVVGHVDRAYTQSFSDGHSGVPHIGEFADLIQRLQEGGRLGAAMEAFAIRHGALAVKMSNLWADLAAAPPPVDEDLFCDTWRVLSDAQNFVIFGDPAVRLATGDPGE